MLTVRLHLKHIRLLKTSSRSLLILRPLAFITSSHPLFCVGETPQRHDYCACFNCLRLAVFWRPCLCSEQDCIKDSTDYNTNRRLAISYRTNTHSFFRLSGRGRYPIFLDLSMTEHTIERTSADASSGPETAASLPAKTKTMKRRRSSSIEIVETRPVKKNCRLKAGSISIPQNNAELYEQEQASCLFLTVCPVDTTNIKWASRKGNLNRITYGVQYNSVVERLIEDSEDLIPWQVPKVTLEYKRIDYVSKSQPYSLIFIEGDGQPVSPTTMPSVDAMSIVEYEEAVERGDPIIARGQGCTFDFCKEMQIRWLPYPDR